jgi:hypothetical protein
VRVIRASPEPLGAHSSKSPSARAGHPLERRRSNRGFLAPPSHRLVEATFFGQEYRTRSLARIQGLDAKGRRVGRTGWGCGFVPLIGVTDAHESCCRVDVFPEPFGR